MRKTASLSLLALGLGIASLVEAAPLSPAPNKSGPATQGNFYCCNDSNGKQVCGDILPQPCYGRAYRELGQSGRVVREVEAPLTAEQRAQRAAEEQRKKEEEAKQKIQQRKDQALLDTYGSEEDIEAMRVRALEEVNKSIKVAETRIEDIRGLRKKYENEAEFYKKKKMPAEVQKGLNDTEFEIKAQQSIIEAKKKEVAGIQAKYDEDRKRFIELRHRPVPH